MLDCEASYTPKSASAIWCFVYRKMRLAALHHATKKIDCNVWLYVSSSHGISGLSLRQSHSDYHNYRHGSDSLLSFRSRRSRLNQTDSFTLWLDALSSTSRELVTLNDWTRFVLSKGNRSRLLHQQIAPPQSVNTYPVVDWRSSGSPAFRLVGAASVGLVGLNKMMRPHP